MLRKPQEVNSMSKDYRGHPEGMKKKPPKGKKRPSKDAENYHMLPKGKAKHSKMKPTMQW
jgi:hypothetical protein